MVSAPQNSIYDLCPDALEFRVTDLRDGTTQTEDENMLPATFSISRINRSAILAASLAVAVSLSAATASMADSHPIIRGIQGAIGGAVIGGVLAGKKGAARGAGIGAAIGILSGAAEAERGRSYDDRARPYRAPVRRSGLVYDVQKTLADLGYDPGPTDGIYGTQTAQAIGAYQDDNDLEVDGAASEDLLDHMISRGG